MQTTYRRDFTLERSAVDLSKKTVELSFSDETPVMRDFGLEILSHAEGAVDLSRLNSGGPVLWSHDVKEMVGQITRAWVSNGKGRAVVKIGNSERAKALLADLADGLTPGVSVGYQIETMEPDKERDGTRAYRATKWTPFEVSFVSCPASTGVGIGRSADTSSSSKIEIMETSNVRTHDPKALLRMADSLRKTIPEVDGLVRQAIDGEWTEDQFRRAALDCLPRDVQPMQRPTQIDLPQRDWSRYSITKAITGYQSGRFSGLERELSDELYRESGTQPQGVMIPTQVFARNFVAGDSSLGGALVPMGHGNFIDLLRNKARCVELGARVMQLNNPITMSKQLTAGGVNWTGETVAATLSAGTFGGVTLTPKVLTAWQQYSRQLLYTSNPSIDQLVREDIVNIISLEIDRAALYGTGQNSEPTGIFNTSDINVVTLNANGAALTTANALAAMVSLEAKLATANADSGALGFLAHTKHRAALRNVERFASSGNPLWTDDDRILGYKALASNQISTSMTQGTATTIASAIVFANWADLVIGQFGGGIEIISDPYTLSHQGVVRLTCRTFVDVALAHPESVAILQGILAG